MKALQAIKDFTIELFEHVAEENCVSRKGFRVKVMVKKHSIAYGPDDSEEEPRHITTFAILDSPYRRKYGTEVDIESKDYYMSTRVNEEMDLWLMENPEYDPHKLHSQKLILAD